LRKKYGETIKMEPTESIDDSMNESMTGSMYSTSPVHMPLSPMRKNVGALLGLRESIPELRRLIGWAELTDASDLTKLALEGVTVDDDGCVTAIDLCYRQLTGQIPPDVAGLHALETMRLNNNHLSGIIPSSIGECRSLADIRLGHNQLVGLLPPSIGDPARGVCPKLTHLSVAGNANLGGSVSAALFTKPGFERLEIEGCHGGYAGRIETPFIIGVSFASESAVDILRWGKEEQLDFASRVMPPLQLEGPFLGEGEDAPPELQHRCEKERTAVLITSEEGGGGGEGSSGSATIWHLLVPVVGGEVLDPDRVYKVRKVRTGYLGKAAEVREVAGKELQFLNRYKHWQRVWYEGLQALAATLARKGPAESVQLYIGSVAGQIVDGRWVNMFQQKYCNEGSLYTAEERQAKWVDDDFDPSFLLGAAGEGGGEEDGGGGEEGGEEGDGEVHALCAGPASSVLDWERRQLLNVIRETNDPRLALHHINERCVLKEAPEWYK
jgi:hypothetical protein